MSRRLFRAAAIRAALIVAVALGGCDLGPDYKRPDTATPGEWREGDRDESVAWPSAARGQAFGSAGLNPMMTTAQQANADLGAATAPATQPHAPLRIAGPALLPPVHPNPSPST